MKIDAKKIVSVLLAVVTLVSVCAPCAAYAADDEPEEPFFLLLGDSIPDAFGIANRDEACYGRIIADTNHYRYRNLGRTAQDSSELIDFINLYAAWDDEEDRFINVSDSIEQADIICLSIGANDYFDSPDAEDLLIGAVLGTNDAVMDKIAEDYYRNLCTIIDLIRELNPDATIILQTIYCVWYGIAARANRGCSSRVNKMIERYDSEHPGQVHICDIAPAMERKPENLADDCVHPNAKGNVAIAEVLLQKLYDLGLGSETTPVVNVEGNDWHYFLDYSETRSKGIWLTMLVMFVTGNGINIFRFLREVRAES